MNFRATMPFVLLLALSAVCSEDPATLLTTRGKLLLEADFSKDTLDGWSVAKGKWDLADGILSGSELPEDSHAAVLKRNLDLKDGVIQVTFRMHGAKQFAIGLNNKNGHVGRAVLSGATLTVAKDKPNKKTEEKGEKLATKPVKADTAEWQTILLEFRGKELLARLDDETVALGTHDGLDVEKTNFAFPVGGQSVEIKSVKVWEATENPAWNDNKAKLSAQ
jgi:hypothetical protein